MVFNIYKPYNLNKIEYKFYKLELTVNGKNECYSPTQFLKFSIYVIRTGWQPINYLKD